MEIIKSSVELITPVDKQYILNLIEYATRNCYQSFDKVKEGSAEILINSIKERNHWTPFENFSLTFKIITNRGVMAELTRHRHASFNVMSTRYVNYSKDKFGNQVKFIDIAEGFPETDVESYLKWENACRCSEDYYMDLINFHGQKPDMARSVLNNSVATEIIMTANLRELYYMIKLRTAPPAHPEIRVIMNKVCELCKFELPEIFGDL